MREVVLAEDGVTRVVRVGATVRRPARPFTASVQAFLQHLWAKGLRCIPEPLGYDDHGREVLSFVAGDVPTEPLPDWATTEAALVALAQMIRRLHDAACDFVAPVDAAWGSIPGKPDASLQPLFAEPELIAHQDYCPGNVVFRDGVPAALIDFDLARPTTRVVDCVNALGWWAPLLEPRDRSPSLRDCDVAKRCRLFTDAYDMSAEQRAQVAEIAVRRSRNNLVTMQAAADVDPVFRRWWEQGTEDRLQRAERWVSAHGKEIDAALTT